MVDTRFPVSIHIMTVLAARRPELVSSEELARSIKTNPSFVRKLVISLSNAGLVECVRGKSGGARLKGSPKDITLDRIYRAVDIGNLVAVPQKSPTKSCAVSCSMSEILSNLSQEIQDGTLRELAKRNLKEILDQVKR